MANQPSSYLEPKPLAPSAADHTWPEPFLTSHAADAVHTLHTQLPTFACPRHPSFQRLGCPAPDSLCQSPALLGSASLGEHEAEALLAHQAEPGSHTVPWKHKGSKQGLPPVQAEIEE